MLRKVLIGLDGFLAFTAIGGGIALLGDWFAPPLDYLAGSPFPDYTIPGLALLVLVGGGSLGAMVLLARRHPLGVPASGLAGLAVVIFEIVEVAVLLTRMGRAGYSVLQPFYVVYGLAMLALAARLWSGERAAPGRRLAGSHA